jgi:hypothetical protein
MAIDMEEGEPESILSVCARRLAGRTAELPADSSRRVP